MQIGKIAVRQRPDRRVLAGAAKFHGLRRNVGTLTPVDVKLKAAKVDELR